MINQLLMLFVILVGVFIAGYLLIEIRRRIAFWLAKKQLKKYILSYPDETRDFLNQVLISYDEDETNLYLVCFIINCRLNVGTKLVLLGESDSNWKEIIEMFSP